jgi:uncharacterized protein YecT (DUF1311 family)
MTCEFALAEKAHQQMQRKFDLAVAVAGEVVERGYTRVDFRPEIRESQRLWEQWKESQCRLEDNLIMGTAGGDVHAECYERLISDRTTSLEKMVETIAGMLTASERSSIYAKWR